MAKKPRKKIYACKNGHKILSDIKNEKRLVAGKMICGMCGEKFSPYSPASWSSEKHFLCGNGHVVSVGAFSNGFCNFSWGNRQGEWVNLEYSPEELSALLSKGEVQCPVADKCKQNLLALEDCQIVVPNISVAKTKTRVGDVWDKYGCPHPSDGKYDKKSYQFKESAFTKVNKERVKKLREKRNTSPVGEIIDRATSRNYRDRNDKRPTKADI